MWVRLARWRNQSQSPCLKALGGVFKKERWQEYMNNSSHPQSPLLKLISSILGCDFCSPTTLSLCSSHWAVERDFTTESLFWRKGTIPIEGELLGDEASCLTLSVPFSPHRPSDQTRLKVTCRAKVVRSRDMPCSSLHHTGSQIIHNRVAADEDVSTHAVCTAPNVQFTDSSLYIYTLYMTCLVHCQCMTELHD